MKTIYSLLVAICVLSSTQVMYANHERGSDKNFHFGPVPNETGGQGDKEAEGKGEDR